MGRGSEIVMKSMLLFEIVQETVFFYFPLHTPPSASRYFISVFDKIDYSLNLLMFWYKNNMC